MRKEKSEQGCVNSRVRQIFPPYRSWVIKVDLDPGFWRRQDTKYVQCQKLA